MELAALEREESCEHSGAFIFDGIFFILAGNEDMPDSLDELKFGYICNRVTPLIDVKI